MEEKDKSQLGINNVEDMLRQRIFTVRKKKVMIDMHLAELYGVSTKVFNQAIKRNLYRFPEDFMFQLTYEEFELNRSQIVTGSQKHRDPRYLPHAFTEYGAVMLSSVLNSEQAIQMSIFIVRAFIKMRESLDNYRELALKVGEIEKNQIKDHAMLKNVHEVLKHLLESPIKPKEKIGFNTK